ncbi:MAG: glycosyl hydrolase [Bacteroidales bacterium]
MHKYLILLFFIVFFSSCKEEQNIDYSLETNSDIDYQNLHEGFTEPPDEVKIKAYWWWLNSNVTKESIRKDLTEMKEKGFGGAVIFDAGSSNYSVAKRTPAGPVFLSEDWQELYAHTVNIADSLELELSINAQSGWNPGAPTVTPELAMKKLVWTEHEVEGPGETTLELEMPDSNLFYEDVMVQAIRKPEDGERKLKNEAIKYWDKKSFNEQLGWKGIYPLHQVRETYTEENIDHALQKDDVIDLSGKFNNGRLIWDIPQGEWVIIRYGMTCTGARTSTTSDGWGGLSYDHLNPEAFEIFEEDVLNPLVSTAKSAGNSLKYLHTDSWEMGLATWTNHFEKEFQKFRGYDITQYMPVLTGRVVGSRGQTNRFLSDYRKTVGDCIAANHYELFKQYAHRQNLATHPESGGPHSAPIDALKVMSMNDIPMGEFWARSNTHRVKASERLSVKQSACVAHTSGKRFVQAEGPTSIGPQWERAPKDLKGLMDRIFCAGVNRVVWHTYTSSPDKYGIPGNEYFAGTHFNRHVTWWDESRNFVNYLNRTQHLLSQGLFSADVLYYYGDQVPNFIFMKNEVKELDFGYNWDKCAKNVILNRVSVENQQLTLPDGMTYQVLRLPDREAINLEVLRKVEELVKNGATVIGPRPERATGLSEYPESDKEVKEIAGRLWGDIDGRQVTQNTYGEGKVIHGPGINQVLEEKGVIPDLTFNSSKEETQLDYIHRYTDDLDIYFVVNRFAYEGIDDFKYRYKTSLPDRYEQVEVGFRVTGKVPEIWDPMTGETKKVSTYREENGRTYIPLHFAPEGSKFIVFREDKDKDHDTHITKITRNGKDLFPVSDLPVLKHPYIEPEYSGGDLTAAVYEPGEYELTFSDGNVKTFTFNRPLQEKRIKSPWEVSFDPEWGGPEDTVFNELRSWTAFDAKGIRYYSGDATYEQTFNVSREDMEDQSVFLDLGDVLELASVRLNRKDMGVQWKSPFRVDVTDEVKAGENTLEIEVTNLWPNRLIGDSKLPEEERYTRTNVTKFDEEDSEKYMRKSGLLGPVKVVFVEKININN